MEFRIENLTEKILIGIHQSMIYANNSTPELWRRFMPRKKEVQLKLNSDLYSIQFYPPGSGPMSGDPYTVFEKWAAVEVGADSPVPVGMEKMWLQPGKYAVFLHHGPASAFMKTFRFIFNTWLPASEFTVDDRPHFEVLPENYRPDDPVAQEEIWIPIKFRD